MMKILTIGTFDLIHPGHVEMLNWSAQLGELWVGVNSDLFVKKYKGAYPAMNEQDRMAVVRGIAGVHEVRLNNGKGWDLIKLLDPKIVTIGHDWLAREYLTQIGTTEEQFFSGDRGLLFAPPFRTPGRSSTEIKQRVHSDRR